MRKTGRTLGLVATAALVAGMTTPALAATSRHGHVSRSAVAFRPGSGQSVVDWNRELITILGTPGAQPATVHPTRSFAILQAAEYDAVTSITHAAPAYLPSIRRSQLMARDLLVISPCTDSSPATPAQADPPPAAPLTPASSPAPAQLALPEAVAGQPSNTNGES